MIDIAQDASSCKVLSVRKGAILRCGELEASLEALVQ
jgi:hypothetical protein